jgi:hypothetical protein
VSSIDHSQSSRQGEFPPPSQPDLRESTAKDPAVGGQKWAVSFTTTRWSVVLEAQTETPTAQEALEKLCQIYWHPIYSFVQRKGVDPEEAKDITQEFFADLLEHRSLTAVRKESHRRTPETARRSGDLQTRHGEFTLWRTGSLCYRSRAAFTI